MRLLGENRNVGVRDAITARADAGHRLAHELGAAAIGVARVGVGVVTADVARSDRAEKRIRQRMQRGVGVGVAGKTALARNLYPGEHEPPSGNERVDVEPVTDAKRHGVQARVRRRALSTRRCKLAAGAGADARRAC